MENKRILCSRNAASLDRKGQRWEEMKEKQDWGAEPQMQRPEGTTVGQERESTGGVSFAVDGVSHIF